MANDDSERPLNIPVRHRVRAKLREEGDLTLPTDMEAPNVISGREREGEMSGKILSQEEIERILRDNRPFSREAMTDVFTSHEALRKQNRKLREALETLHAACPTNCEDYALDRAISNTERVLAETEPKEKER